MRKHYFISYFIYDEKEKSHGFGSSIVTMDRTEKNPDALFRIKEIAKGLDDREPGTTHVIINWQVLSQEEWGVNKDD